MSDPRTGDSNGGGVECAEGLEAGVAFTKGDGEIALSFGNGELFE